MIPINEQSVSFNLNPHLLSSRDVGMNVGLVNTRAAVLITVMRRRRPKSDMSERRTLMKLIQRA